MGALEGFACVPHAPSGGVVRVLGLIANIFEWLKLFLHPNPRIMTKPPKGLPPDQPPYLPLSSLNPPIYLS